MTDSRDERPAPDHLDVVCFSLEPWDEVWRRNQWLSTELLRLRPSLRLLFAELPVDVIWSLFQRKMPHRAGLRAIGDSGRLWAMAPYKWAPRRVWPGGDRDLGRQVLRTARRLGMSRPVLWVNDSTYADLVPATGWPSVYDVTDDWLLAHSNERELARQQRNDRLLLDRASEVVVCSPALAETRGRDRPVHLVPNGVDVDHLRRPQSRPDDLPPGRILMYQGSLTDGRLDVDLCIDVARRVADRATLVLLGPDSLSDGSADRLREAGTVILGSRPYTSMPGYLQHADALLVPHRVTAFTESLDPIKAREFVAVGRPTVSTPVAGFRDLGPPVVVATRERFVDETMAVLDETSLPPGPGPLESSPTTWAERAGQFLAVLDAAAASDLDPRSQSTTVSRLPGRSTPPSERSGP